MASYLAVMELTGGPGLGCLAGATAAGEEEGGFLVCDGFMASYLAVMELTGGPGLGGLTG